MKVWYIYFIERSILYHIPREVGQGEIYGLMYEEWEKWDSMVEGRNLEFERD
jgi:hypothetical protein